MKESIAEMDEMETLRLETELEKQRLSVTSSTSTSSNATTININNNSKSSNDLHMVNRGNRDSGITGDSSSNGGNYDQPMRHSGGSSNTNRAGGHRHQSNGNAVVLRKSAINNSLLDLTDASEKMTRRGSVGSLDSGMSISFVQSSTTNGGGGVGIVQTHAQDGHSNHSTTPHHPQQHSVSRIINNGGASTTQSILGTCNNCINTVGATIPLSAGNNNHAGTCYHHMHHHHYHHHHHNLQLQHEYQQHPSHNIGTGGTGTATSSNSGNLSNNTVASITSALL